MNSSSSNVAPSSSDRPVVSESVGDEREFLRAEEERVKAALGQSVEELKESLKTAASLETWAKTYPWAALGVAIAGGFTLATIVTPKKGESVADSLSALAPGKEANNGEADSAKKVAKKSAFISLLLSALFELAKNFAVSRFKAAMETPTPNETHNDAFHADFDDATPQA